MMLPLSVGPVNGLKLCVKAASPDPVITRHLWALAADPDAEALVADVADAPGTSVAVTTATAAIAPAVTRRRVARARFLIPYPLR
jgi:hypothetical protein